MRLYTNEELKYLDVYLNKSPEEKNVVIEKDYLEKPIYPDEGFNASFNMTRIFNKNQFENGKQVFFSGEKGKYLFFYGPEIEIDFSVYDKSYLKELNGVIIKCHKAEELDLTSLDVCRNLKYFNVHRTNIQKLDLSFLTDNPIILLSLTDNRIESLDLSPLKSCNDLTTLSLNGNNLKNLNLSPIEKLSNLDAVDISNNSLNSINLKIFENIPLRQLYFHSFVDFKSIDLSPLFSKKSLMCLSYNDALSKGGDEEAKGFCDQGRGVRIDYCDKTLIAETDSRMNMRCERYDVSYCSDFWFGIKDGVHLSKQDVISIHNIQYELFIP